MKWLVALFAIAALPLQALAREVSPQLSARPHTSAVTMAAGTVRLADGSLAYRPPNATSSSLPLLVLLHGGGEDAATLLKRFQTVAVERGLLLLAPRSAGPTWDLVPRSEGRGGALALKVRSKPRFGRDVQRVDAALAALFASAAVNPRRVVLLGFSDGASFALSLGTANPGLFSAVIALSPGFVVVPGEVAPAQRLIIVHGRGDPVLSFDTTRRDILSLLRTSGFKPVFLDHEGGHRIDEPTLRQALDLAFATPTPTSPARN